MFFFFNVYWRVKRLTKHTVDFYLQLNPRQILFNYSHCCDMKFLFKSSIGTTFTHPAMISLIKWESADFSVILQLTV